MFGICKEESEADPGRLDYLKVYVPGGTSLRQVKRPWWAWVRSLQHLAEVEGVEKAIDEGWADLEAMRQMSGWQDIKVYMEGSHTKDQDVESSLHHMQEEIDESETGKMCKEL